MAKMVKDSAGQIWLAGLGAFAKAQEEGGKLFESLVQEGEKIDARTKKVTGETVGAVKDRVEDTVGEVKGKASDTWDKLEQVFEDRVSRSLNALGVPTRDDVDVLLARVEELNESVTALMKSQGTEAPVRPRRSKGRAKKKTAT